MVGEAVMHVRFGNGDVISFEPPRITIAFNNGTEKTFACPQSVGRFIRFEREEAQKKAERDRGQAEIVSQELKLAETEGRRGRPSACRGTSGKEGRYCKARCSHAKDEDGRKYVMKRVIAACLYQTLHFQLKEDYPHDDAVRLVRAEVENYKAGRSICATL